MKIPVCEPLLGGNELKYVTQAINDNWISSGGPFLQAFESKFAEYIGTKYALACSNGTAALHLACAALNLKAGDEVILPDFTMISSAFSICYTGATPVFVDSCPDTWNIDPKKIEEKITPRTKAIMPVHIYGLPCDMAPIKDLAVKHGLSIIEDAAEVHGATYNEQKCGSIGDVGCFSLFANKIITSGEGGVITTNSDEIYDRCRYLRNLAFPLEGPREYQHAEIGFNYRMPDVVAAIAFAQYERIDDYVSMRQNNAMLYKKFLADIPGIILQSDQENSTNVYWMFGVLLDSSFPVSRNELMEQLGLQGIGTRKFFYPMHKQKSLLEFGCKGDSRDFPVCNNLAENGLYLPSGSGLTEEQIKFVCEQILNISKK